MQPEIINGLLSEGVKLGETASRSSRLIRLPEVIQRVGISRSAIYKRMADGAFPRSRSLGPKCAVWVEAEIDDWILTITEI